MKTNACTALRISAVVVGIALASAPATSSQDCISQVIATSGSGSGNSLLDPWSVAVDALGNTYVTGASTHNAFKIAVGGAVSQIIDASGDGLFGLNTPVAILADAAQNVYVAGFGSNSVFRITATGVISRILASNGDGAGNALLFPSALAVDAAGTLHVAGSGSDNVFRITAPGELSQTVELVLAASGDGAGNPLDRPAALAVDAVGNLYVAGGASDNVFQVTPAGTVTAILDATGDGLGHALDGPEGVAVDGSGTVFVTGAQSDNLFRISAPAQPGQVVREILNDSGDGLGNVFLSPVGIDIDAAGTVFVAASQSHNAFEIRDPGLLSQSVRELIDSSGDGLGHPLTGCRGIAADGLGGVHVAGRSSNNAFRIASGPAAATFRNGLGLNPAVFSEVTPALIGQNWNCQVDLAPSGAVASVVAFTLGGPLNSGLVLAGLVQGELLVLPPLIRPISAELTGQHAILLPPSCSYVGRPYSVQAALFTPGSLQLTNALDLVIGTF